MMERSSGALLTHTIKADASDVTSEGETQGYNMYEIVGLQHIAHCMEQGDKRRSGRAGWSECILVRKA